MNMTTVSNFERTIITVITRDSTQEFIQLLHQYKTTVNIMNVIPNTIESWGITPDTIVIDSISYSQWEQQINKIKEESIYKEIPVIVLNEKEVSLEDVLSLKDKEFLLLHRNETISIIRAIFGTVKYWRKLNESLIKTNQLNRILSTNYLSLDAKTECLEKSKNQIEAIYPISNSEVKTELIKINNNIIQNLKNGNHYELFKAHFEEVHPQFYKKLLLKESSLSNNDLKLAALLKMGFNNTEISFFMGISISGVKKAIQRLRKKLGLDPASSLRQFIYTIEV
ncbi:hypothetical protein GCM10009430_43280 [Aquimarina litoralis]|uniref:HTH luxR-type domain-containing protein n=1 Tax=Aquimarina litoralis TaxID=584605 RepID=A0ABP3UDS8_9FLAO